MPFSDGSSIVKNNQCKGVENQSVENGELEVIVRVFIVFAMVLSATGLLAGCATPAEEAAYAQHEMDRRIAIYGPACERLGYTANTDPWRNCVMQLSYKNDMQRYSFTVSPYWAY
jgi:hypothetical protein